MLVDSIAMIIIAARTIYKVRAIRQRVSLFLQYILRQVRVQQCPQWHTDRARTCLCILIFYAGCKVIVKTCHGACLIAIIAHGFTFFLNFGTTTAVSGCRQAQRRRRELSTTLTLEHAMSALAHIGVIWKSMPKAQSTPAASGMHTML